MGRSPVAIRQKKASNFFEQKIRTKMLMKLTTSIKGTKTPLGITLRRLRSDLLSHKLKLILSSDLAQKGLARLKNLNDVMACVRGVNGNVTVHEP